MVRGFMILGTHLQFMFCRNGSPKVSILQIDVRGRMRARLTVTSDCEDTCFYVRVSVQKDDGKWYLLRDDITSLCADGADYVPSSEKMVSFRFADHAFRLEKGDRLRVDTFILYVGQ